MKLKLILLALLLPLFGKSQNSFYAIVKDSTTKETLPGVAATLQGTKQGSISDINGFLKIENISDGTIGIVFSYVGYKKLIKSYHFPRNTQDTAIILMPSEAIEEEVITVTSTRTNSRIEDVPVRIEVIGQEDIEEETVMQPANISMLLGETTGIQTQNTSATSGNINIRIQGLDGRYTQILKDGFPLYGGFSGSLSIMQIPPLDLKQAELIKGSSSTLYGGDAIAGILNFVSKTPTTKPENIIILNQTSLKETDLGGFFSGRTDKLGYTLLVNSVNGQAVDVNHDGFSDVPQLSQLSFAPKFFVFGKDSSQFTAGMNATYEDRSGGDMYAIRYRTDSNHTFLERSRSERYYSQLRYDGKLGNRTYMTIKNSFGLYNRSLESGAWLFKGQQLNSFSEASILHKSRKHDLVGGASFITEDFKEDETLSRLDRSYHFATAGLFLQDDWHLANSFVLEGGIRGDYQNKYGVFVLPRISAIYHITKAFTTRLGGGLGYKSPTIFTSAAEEAGYRNVLPIDKNIKPENAAGANLDFTLKLPVGSEWVLTINQAFYYTQLQSPLVQDTTLLSKNIIHYVNAASPVESKGSESSLRLGTERFDFVAAYTYIDAEKKYDLEHKFLPFVPQHRFVSTAVYNRPHQWRLGLETFWTGMQLLPDNSKTRDFFVMGIMLEREFKNFMIILNGENLTDTRQTRYENVVLGPMNAPSFRPIWAPLEGRVFNVVLKMRF